ncbi:MAG: hypothetical protein AAF738_08960, partial [Bacteroidota bacterium]
MVPQQWLSLALWSMLFLAHTTFSFAQTPCSTLLTVTNTNDDGLGSLREALACANSTEGANTIQFAVTGAAPHIIYVGENTGEPLVIFDAQTTIEGSLSSNGISEII